MPKPKREKRLQFTNLTNPWQRFRSRTGLSQVDLAKALKIGQSAVSQYEYAGRYPEPAIAARFVSLCRRHKVPCSMDEVYGGLKG